MHLPKRKNNNSQLYEAAKCGYVIEVARCIEAGADVNWKNDAEFGNSALMIASLNGHLEIVNALLDQGAALHDKNINGNSPLLAASYGLQSEVIEVLVQRGADINDRTNDLMIDGRCKGGGHCALNIAASNNNYEIINMLLNRGADVNNNGVGRNSPLIEAAQRSDANIVTTLINKGADLNYQNGYGYTALKSAVTLNLKDNIEVLQSQRSGRVCKEAGKTQLCNSIVGNKFNEEWISTVGISNNLSVEIHKADIYKESGIWSKKNENEGIFVEFLSRLASLKLDEKLETTNNAIVKINQPKSHNLEEVDNLTTLPSIGTTSDIETPPPNVVVAISEKDESNVRKNLEWLNSIAVSMADNNGNNNQARIALVGTRKDIIDNPTDHLEISNIIFEKFEHHPLFKLNDCLIENEDSNDIHDKLCFFPVNNREGGNDHIIRTLMNRVESVISESSYAKKKVPFTWMKSIDQLSSLKKCDYNKDEVIAIMNENGLIAEAEQVEALKFFREMGSILWFNDDEILKSIIIFDVVNYFVHPITSIIRNHNKDSTDGSTHPLHSTEEVPAVLIDDLNRMKKTGQITEPLLKYLLSDHINNYDSIVKLMLLFDLMVLLLPEYKPAINVIPSSQTEPVPVYMIPSLLPHYNNIDHIQLINCYEWPHRCYLVFTLPSCELFCRSVMSSNELLSYGFLPKGIFERIIIKSLRWCQNTSLYDFTLFREKAILRFGRQTFQLSLSKWMNAIEVSVTGDDPLAICNRIKDQLDEVLKELRYKNLVAFIALHLLDDNKNIVYNNDNDEDMVEKCSGQVVVYESIIINESKALQFYREWLRPKRILPDYPDLFLSYRWSDDDKSFIRSMSDAMTNFNIGDNSRSVVLFVDEDCLPVGCSFQVKFANCLIATSVVCPIISKNTLDTIKSNPSQVDNVLLEWCLAIECYDYGRKGKCRVAHVYPIFRFDVWEKDAMSGLDVVLAGLSDEIPLETIGIAETLLLSNGITPSSSLKTRTIKQIFERIRGFLCCKAYEMKYQSRPCWLICKEMVDFIFSRLTSTMHDLFLKYDLSHRLSSVVNKFKEMKYFSLFINDFVEINPIKYDEVEVLNELLKKKYNYNDIDNWEDTDKWMLIELIRKVDSDDSVVVISTVKNIL
eukprot:gene9604-12933_t